MLPIAYFIVRLWEKRRTTVSHRYAIAFFWAFMAARPCFSQTAWRWLVVAGDNRATEHLCWVPQNTATLVVAAGREEACWTRIVQARGIETDGPRAKDIAELCLIAAKALKKPEEKCSVPKIDTVFRAEPSKAAPNAAEILRSVAEAYKAVKDYDLTAESTDKAGTHIRMRTAFKAPDRYRMEGTGPASALGLDGLAPDSVSNMVIVFDGAGAWFYLPEPNLYGFFPVASMTGPDTADLRPEMVDYYLMWHYREAEKFIGKAEFLREEMVEIAGEMLDCYVLSVPDVGSDTWWVETKSRRVVQVAEKDTITKFPIIRLNQPLSNELFRFAPPLGAKQIERQP